MKQLNLFGEEVAAKKAKKLEDGSKNPSIFYDYDSFVKKFNKENPKTTDDCYTPKDVYDCVLDYVDSIYPLEGKLIYRPFFPGGDYENDVYPEECVVIDNPPFSILAKIVRFYMANDIKFFLFGYGMTILDHCRYGASAVIINHSIKFDNGAIVRVNFVTNLIKERVITAPSLNQALKKCEIQQSGAKKLTKKKYPKEVISVSMLQSIARGNEPFAIGFDESELITKLDLDNSKNGLFGSHLLVSRAAAERAAAERAAAEGCLNIQLSEREQRIVDRLSK